MTSSAVERVEREHPIARLITAEKARKYIEPFLPQGINIERVAASVMLAVRNDESGKLGKCTPESLVLGAARIQQWHLELGVTAHLIPFGEKAVPVADYKGLCELMIASKAVRYVEAREVREGDDFDFAFGLEPFLRHKPISKNRAAITHVYCIIHLPFGRKAFEVMSAAAVDAIRQQYSKQHKEGPLTAWYAKKTIIRQTAKLLPKSPELAQLFNVLETDETNLDEPRRAEEVGAGGAAPAGPGRLAPRSQIDDEDDDLPF